MLLDACKDHLLRCYYLATLPHRRQSSARRKAQGQVPMQVLFYHRVADDHPNDWTISPESFSTQVDWLQEQFDIVSLQEAQRRIECGQNDIPTVSITFDDGYADNCRTAVPYLLEREIPFTYFVTTDNTRSGEPFTHDRQAGCPLEPNTVEQLREMAAAGVEIGAHTRTHADLGQLDDEQALYNEIVGSKRDLESLLDRPVHYFAFPFGMPENMSPLAFRIAFQAGLWGVCSAYGGYNFPGDDGFHLQRIHGDPLWGRFRNWLTIDPRKLRNPEHFELGDYRFCF